VVNSDGTFTYTPTGQIRHAASAVNAPETAKTDSFTVNVSDGYGGVATETINVPVTPANANPVGGAITGLQSDDIIGVVTGSVTGVSDPDLDTLGYSSNPTSVGGGNVDVYSDGSFTYNPTAEQRHLAAALGAPFTSTHDSFTISVSDGHGGSTAITIVVPVPPESDEPPTGVAAG
jgi:VCBS repeat-containing protein